MSSVSNHGPITADADQGSLPFGGPPAPARAPLPRPERLNRNALTVAAVVMGTLVLAAVVFVQPTRPSGDPHARAGQAAQPAQSTFLDQPPINPSSSMSNGGSSAQFGDTALHAPSAGPSSSQGATSGMAPISPEPYANPYVATSTAAANPAIDSRVDAYHAALTAPVVSTAQPLPVIQANGGSLDATSRAGADGELGQRDVSGTAPSGAGMNAGEASYGLDATLPQARETVPSTASNGSPTAFRTSVQAAPGPYAIQAGTVIPAVLVTGINSDLPGQVLAQVSRDVYDSRSLRALLIPKGAKLLGKYTDQVGIGQNRLLVAWSRVLLPDGRSITLPGLETKDRTGAGGLHDQVDRHGRQAFGTAALLSLIGAGVQLSQPNGGYGALGSYPTPGQVAAGAVGQQLADVATQMLRRDLNVQPTIRIRQGMPFNVFIATDLVFAEPYVPGP